MVVQVTKPEASSRTEEDLGGRLVDAENVRHWLRGRWPGREAVGQSPCEWWLFSETDVRPDQGLRGWVLGLTPKRRLIDVRKRRLTHIASSRIGRRWDLADGWIEGVRQIMRQLDPPSTLLLNGVGTTAEPLLRFAAKRLGIEVWHVAGGWGSNRRHWLDRQCNQRVTIDARVWPVARTQVTDPWCFDPSRCSLDGALVDLASQLWIAALRREGGIVKLLRERDRDQRPRGSRHYWTHPDWLPADLQQELSRSGFEPLQHRTPQKSEERTVRIDGTLNDVDTTELDSDRWLVHCTRACEGPWPGQAAEEYFQELWEGHPDRGRKAVDTLWKILCEQRLRGSATLVAGDQAVVCFCHSTLAEIVNRRVYRKHLRRYDFEPYGVALDVDWVRSAGGVPVIYGDEQTRNGLPSGQRFRYQPETSRAGIDWTRECEWRWRGDLDLASVPANRGRVLVASEADRARLAEVSRFPIVVLPPTSPSIRPGQA